MKSTSDAISRLPKWAQNEVSRLRADVEYYKKQLAAVVGETKTIIEVDPPYSREDHPRKYLPERAQIEFTLPSGKITVSLRDSLVHLYTDHGRIALYPVASNVAYVGISE